MEGGEGGEGLLSVSLNELLSPERVKDRRRQGGWVGE